MCPRKCLASVLTQKMSVWKVEAHPTEICSPASLCPSLEKVGEA